MRNARLQSQGGGRGVASVPGCCDACAAKMLRACACQAPAALWSGMFSSALTQHTLAMLCAADGRLRSKLAGLGCSAGWPGGCAGWPAAWARGAWASSAQRSRNSACANLRAQQAPWGAPRSTRQPECGHISSGSWSSSSGGACSRVMVACGAHVRRVSVVRDGAAQMEGHLHAEGALLLRL
jgi:hypothetical protein